MTRLVAVGSRRGVGRFPKLASPDLPKVKRVKIAGVSMSASDAEELAQRLAHGGSFDLAHRILRAHRERQDVVELDTGEAARALQVLDDPTPGLEPLRGVLLAEAGLNDPSS